jgi:hypothetical protein
MQAEAPTLVVEAVVVVMLGLVVVPMGTGRIPSLPPP